MNSNIKNASVAVVAADDDILLFFDSVFAEELRLKLFLSFQMKELLRRADDFDCVFVDTRTVLFEKDEGRWQTVCRTFKNRIFILSDDYENIDLEDTSASPRVIPYPFTKKDFFMFFNKARGAALSEKYKSKAKSKKPDAAALSKIPEFSRLLGSCEKVNDIKRKILMVADTDTPLVFFGESGTGKTLAAQIAHDISRRRNKPFVIANMANGNQEFFESILFGNVKGAFTDARDREGLFKKADGGTLFMDEIAELPVECQAKLLRVIETGLFRPVGSDEECKSDVRLIFATNADLRALVRKNLFREALYWRIVDFPIEVPALRDRLEDFPLLVQNELKEIQKKWGKEFSITQAALDRMNECEWPGNFRQFKACLRRAAILSRDTGVIDEDAISF